MVVLNVVVKIQLIYGGSVNMDRRKLGGFRGPQELCTPFSQAEVIKLFHEVHGDMYDYSDFIYTRALDKSTIRCNYCGFEKKMSYYHHYKKQSDACISCAKELGKYDTNLLKNSVVYRKLKNCKHYPTTDYSKFEYRGFAEKSTYICTKHNHEYQQMFFIHIKGNYGCKHCALENRQTTAFNKWVEECKLKHSANFNYENAYMDTTYKHAWIQCNMHGWVKVCKSWHKKYGNCAKCTDEQKRGNYELKNYTEDALRQPAILYHVSMHHDHTEFEKVGITLKSGASERFKTYTKCNVVILDELETSLKQCIVRENAIMDELDENKLRYKIKNLKRLKLSGWTECFAKDAINVSKYFR